MFLEEVGIAPEIFRGNRRTRAVHHHRTQKDKAKGHENDHAVGMNEFMSSYFCGHSCYAMKLSEFQRRQCKNSQNDGNDPEPNDDFWFGPAFEFKVMVNGRHFEDPFTGKPE